MRRSAHGAWRPRVGGRRPAEGRRGHRTGWLIALACLASGCAPARPGTAPAPSESPSWDASATGIPTPTHTSAEAAFARNLNPLVGLPAGDADRVEGRPLAYAVRFDAVPDQVSGLQALEWVVEAPPAPAMDGSAPVESWTLTGLSLRPAGSRPALGPVGRAEALQLTISRMFGAAQLLASGADPDTSTAFVDAGIPLIQLSLDTGASASTSRGADPLPTPTGPPPAPEWRFDEAPPGGEPVGALTLPWSADRATVWRYAAPFEVWQRYRAEGQDLTAVLDADTGEPLTSANLLLLLLDGGPGRESAWVGEGGRRLLRDGRVVEGAWQRADDRAPLRLSGADGARLTLRPGNTWLIAIDVAAPYALAP